MSRMTLISEFAIAAELTYTENWYVDNEATSHVTMWPDLFEYFNVYGGTQTVTTADWNIAKAVRKGSSNYKGQRQ